jgi:WD40 repeat protein
LKEVRVSENGKFIAILFLNEISVISSSSWEQMYELDRPSEVVCWSPTSDRFLLGSGDGIVTMLETHESTFRVLGELDGRDSLVCRLDWSNDGKYISICREDSTVSIYNSADITDDFFFIEMECFSRILDAPAQFTKFSSNSEYFGKGIHDHVDVFSECC